MKTLRQAVAAFRVADEVASRSSSTRRRADLVLRTLMEVAGPTTPVARLTRADIDMTLGKMRYRVTENTLNGYRSTLRMFGRWVADTGMVKTNPAAHLRTQRAAVDAHKREALSPAQAKALLKAAAARHPRDFVTCLIMLSTGLRESEVIGLTFRDCNFKLQEFLVYRPKVRDYHRAPWTAQLAEVMRWWADYYEGLHGPLRPSWRVCPALAYRTGPDSSFRMHQGWPMIPDRPQSKAASRVKGWLREIGVEDVRGKGSHTLRRSAANLLLDAGATVDDVQIFLGHSNPATTAIYLNRDAAHARLRERVRDFKI